MRTVIVIILFMALSACSSGGNNPGIVLLNPGPAAPISGEGDPASSSNNDGVEITDIDLGNQNPPGGGAASGSPQASIPAPALRSGSILVFSPDSQTTDVVIGAPGAVQPCRGEPCVRPNDDIEGALSNAGPNPAVENTRVAISTNPLPEPPQESLDPQLTAPISGVINHAPTIRMASVGAQFIAPFIRSAHAQEIVLPPLGPGAPGVEGLCSRPDVICCPVNPDGSFECAVRLVDASVMQLHIATISPEGRIGPAITEQVQPNLHYLATPAQTLTASPDEIFSLNQNRVVALGRESDGRFRVRGARSDQYRAYDANDVQSISYDQVNNLLTLKKQNTVDVASLSTTLRNAFGIREIAGTSTINLNAGEQTTEMKLANGLVSYGVRHEVPQPRGRIYRIMGLSTPQDTIQFFWQDLTTTWLHRETITFDIDAENYGVAVYLDDANNVRLRVGNFGRVISPDQYADIPLSGVAAASLRNLSIYRENLFDSATRTLQLGRALIVDSQNNRIGIIGFDRIGRNPEIRLDRWLDLGAGKNPQVLVLNTARTRAYVLNRGDATVTVLRLDTPDGFPVILGSTDLRQTALPNKDIPLTPNSMAYLPSNGGNDQLVIGLENLRGSIVINAP